MSPPKNGEWIRVDDSHESISFDGVVDGYFAKPSACLTYDFGSVNQFTACAVTNDDDHELLQYFLYVF